MTRQWATLAAASSLACGGVDATPVELQGTNWALVELAGEPVTPGGEPGAGYLRFEAGADRRFGASVGCNGMGGRWNSDGEALGFSEVMSTLMACDAVVMSRERQLTEALATTSTYRVAGNRLELLAGDRVLAAFVADSAPR
jgi:heat shock protein HslJ